MLQGVPFPVGTSKNSCVMFILVEGNAGHERGSLSVRTSTKSRVAVTLVEGNIRSSRKGTWYSTFTLI